MMRTLARRKRAAIILVAALTAIIAAAACSSGPSSTGSSSESDSLLSPAKAPLAPEFAGITNWINSAPLRMSGLRGKVVLIDFWTYSCINCLRTLPYVRDWYAKYADRGLVIVGVHTPEFDFEKSAANVTQAVQQNHVAWAVAQDNDYGTWNAYQNRYWPRKYLIDKDGHIRFDHAGEGAYLNTEQQIRKLLIEAGNNLDGVAIGSKDDGGLQDFRVTREMYAGYGYALGNYLGNASSAPKNIPATFTDTGSYKDGQMYLSGQWQVNQENVQPAGDAHFTNYVAIRFTAGSVNVVVRSSGTQPFRVYATIDGSPLPATVLGGDMAPDEQGRTYVTVDQPRLYNVYKGPLSTHDLKLYPVSNDFLLYTYTFGG